MVKNLFNTVVFFNERSQYIDYARKLENANSKKSIEKLIGELKKENADTIQQLYDHIAREKRVLQTMKGYEKDIKKIESFQKKMEANFKNLELGYTKKKQEVVEKTKNQVQEVKDEVKFDDKNVEHKDKYYDIKWDKDGTLSQKTLVNLFADLDGGSGVEGSNVAWIRKVFGASNQKYEIGERQVFQEIKNMSKSQLNALYARIVGDGSSIADINKKDWTNLKTIDSGDDKGMTVDDQLSDKLMSKFKNFRTKLIEQAGVVADVSSILLKDKDARTGLRSLLQGRTDELYRALSNPAKVQEYVKVLAERGVIEGNDNIFKTIGGILLRLGIQAGIAIGSLGTVTAYVENGKVNHEKLTSRLKLENMKVGAPIGKDGGSVSANLDLAGARFNVDWNNPEARMTAYYKKFLQQNDKLNASKTLVDEWNSKLSKHKKFQEIKQIGESFIKSQETIIKEYNKIPNKTAEQNRIFNDVINNNAIVYMGKVEQVQGLRLQGAFSTVNLSGFAIGLSAARVDVTASAEGVKLGAGSIEASILGAEKIENEEGLNEILKDMGIERRGDVYYQDGKEKVRVKPGHKLQWSIEAINTPDGMSYKILGYKEVSNKSKAWKLKEYNNESIAKNSQLYSDFGGKLGNIHKRDYKKFTAHVSAENYSEAAKDFDRMLATHPKRDRKNRDIVRAAWEGVKNDPKKAEEFLNQFYEKTSGGEYSRKLADRYLNGEKGAINEVKRYYNKQVGNEFAKLFGITKNETMNTLDSILAENKNSPKVQKLSGEGFGAVAYAQKSRGNVRLDYINHQTQILGEPVDVTDKNIINKVKPRLEKLAKQHNPNMSSEEITETMKSGKLKATLSFVENSECFNLIFFMETEGGQNSIRFGTSVGNDNVNKTDGGLGFGRQFKKEKTEGGKKQETTPEAESGNSTPTNAGGNVDKVPKGVGNVVNRYTGGSASFNAGEINADVVDGLF